MESRESKDSSSTWLWYSNCRAKAYEWQVPFGVQPVLRKRVRGCWGSVGTRKVCSDWSKAWTTGGLGRREKETLEWSQAVSHHLWERLREERRVGRPISSFSSKFKPKRLKTYLRPTPREPPGQQGKSVTKIIFFCANFVQDFKPKKLGGFFIIFPCCVRRRF